MRLIKVAILYLILSLASVPFMEPAQSASSWQEDWERVIQAAKKEGKVSVVGFLAREVREVLAQTYTRDAMNAKEPLVAFLREVLPR